MNKEELVADYKRSNPFLMRGDDEVVSRMSDTEYISTINQWADNELARLAEVDERAMRASAKAKLLAKLGITAEEATLLLT